LTGRGAEPTYEEIRRAWKEYEASEGNIDQPLFERVGNRIREHGFLGPDDLYLIVVWKLPARVAQTNAGKALFNNAPEEIEKVTRRALEAVTADKSETAAIKAVGILDDLPQVGIPFASAILAFFDPKWFGAVDENAWRALGWPDEGEWEPKDYGTYLTRIREIGEQCNLTPREVDAALYWIGSEMPGGKTRPTSSW